MSLLHAFKCPASGPGLGSLGQWLTMQSLLRPIANDGPWHLRVCLIPTAAFLWPTWHTGWKNTDPLLLWGAHRPQLPSSPASLYRIIQTHSTLADVTQWTEHLPINQKVTGLIHSQGTCLSCEPGPQLGA